MFRKNLLKKLMNFFLIPLKKTKSGGHLIVKKIKWLFSRWEGHNQMATWLWFFFKRILFFPYDKNWVGT
jgi:hypothetical protein